MHTASVFVSYAALIYLSARSQTLLNPVTAVEDDSLDSAGIPITATLVHRLLNRHKLSASQDHLHEKSIEFSHCSSGKYRYISICGRFPNHCKPTTTSPQPHDVINRSDEIWIFRRRGGWRPGYERCPISAFFLQPGKHIRWQAGADLKAWNRMCFGIMRNSGSSEESDYIWGGRDLCTRDYIDTVFLIWENDLYPRIAIHPSFCLGCTTGLHSWSCHVLLGQTHSQDHTIICCEICYHCSADDTQLTLNANDYGSWMQSKSICQPCLLIQIFLHCC